MAHMSPKAKAPPERRMRTAPRRQAQPAPQAAARTTHRSPPATVYATGGSM